MIFKTSGFTLKALERRKINEVTSNVNNLKLEYNRDLELMPVRI